MQDEAEAPSQKPEFWTAGFTQTMSDGRPDAPDAPPEARHFDGPRARSIDFFRISRRADANPSNPNNLLSTMLMEISSVRPAPRRIRTAGNPLSGTCHMSDFTAL